MAKMNGTKQEIRQEPLHILDSSCGSGRMLMASAKEHGQRNFYYGIDIDHTCVKMATINLFLNGVFRAEVMCGDALNNNDFRASYRTSFLPFGVFKTTEKEKSQLWQMNQNRTREQGINFDKAPELPSKTKGNIMLINSSQLKLL
ncbi:MAG: SAM-dependent DNA methyltransferase [Bacteroidetes bacterium]|nr:SAM-dependent DNA methyltransferase [Bacteroidota bacterium]